MVCREAQIGSAVTSYVIQTTSLEEQQVLSLYHEGMREGRSAPTPTPAQQATLLDSVAESIQNAPGLSDARRRSLLARVERAHNEPMNGQRYYATNRLHQRARRAETALTNYVSATARDLGLSEDETRRRITTMREQAGSDRALRPEPGFVNTMRTSSDSAGLPLDRQTAYAIQQLNADRAIARATAPQRPAVTRHPQPQSSSIAEMGYNDTTGRVEVVLRSSPDVPYAYRMTREQWNEFAGARSVGSFYATRVRGNAEYRYADSDAADSAGTQTQCASCGQFASDGHACPPRGSAEEISVTTRRARQAARQRATPEAPAVDPASTEPVRIQGSRRRYHGASGSFNTVGLTDVQQAARRNGVVTIPVDATINTIAGPEGPQAVVRGQVTGTANVSYNGRGRGYTASGNTTPGDTGRDNLRCTCPDYQRNYDCVHVRQAVQDLTTRLNQDALRQQHEIGAAIDQVNTELAQDLNESVAAQAVSQETWGASSVNYTDDVAAFQADYKAAKDRHAAGEPAVVYMTENATDGLGARGTGRAFGVELEFDVAPGVNQATAMRNIGQALHAAGLTTSARQAHYHAAESRGYTENHQGGWSFENDCTVAGEIVSPIMYDTPETWENLAKVCKIIRDNGGVVTQRTGSHVHVSAHNYDHTVANHNRLMGAFAENEDVLYRLSSNPDRGSHRGPRWCAPNRVPASGYSNINDARNRNNSHNLGLNMQSVAGRSSDHVEFRTYDASLDEAIIQTQIKMSLGITEAAFRDSDYQPGGHTPLGSHRAHNRRAHGSTRRLTGEAWHQDTAGFRTFADRIFRRPEDKAQLTALFSRTRWQRGDRA